MKLFSLFSIAAASLSLASASQAALVSYSIFANTNFSGTLDGVPFSATSISVTATADTTNIQSGLFFDNSFPILVNAVNPTIFLNTNSGPITLSALPEYAPIAAFAADLFTHQGDYIYGFGSFDEAGSGYWDFYFSFNSTDPIGSDLATHTTRYGGLGSAYFATNLGPLNLSFNPGTEGTFTVGPAAVPEPATATSSLLLSLGGLSLISRRKRKA